MWSVCRRKLRGVVCCGVVLRVVSRVRVEWYGFAGKVAAGLGGIFCE